MKEIIITGIICLLVFGGWIYLLYSNYYAREEEINKVKKLLDKKVWELKYLEIDLIEHKCLASEQLISSIQRLKRIIRELQEICAKLD